MLFPTWVSFNYHLRAISVTVSTCKLGRQDYRFEETFPPIMLISVYFQVGKPVNMVEIINIGQLSWLKLFVKKGRCGSM